MPSRTLVNLQQNMVDATDQACGRLVTNAYLTVFDRYPCSPVQVMDSLGVRR
jgi:hypothetical protein